MSSLYTTYVTIQEAQAFFECKLHEVAWSSSTAKERVPALIEATRIIDSLSFKGVKSVVYLTLQNNPDATVQELQDVAATQDLEFPRGADTSIPERIQWACCEIAYALLDGVDPEFELENMSMNDHGIGSVRASFNRNQNPLEHFMNGVPSSTAWKYLRPFLRDDKRVRLTRVS
jgi:hypothetical protein